MRILLTLFILVISVSFVVAGTITGTVTSKDSGEPLAGANVYLQGTTVGAATDADGNYTIMASDGTYNLVCDYVGFAKVSISLLLAGDVAQNFELKENLFAKTINVVASRAVQRETPVAFTNVEAEEIDQRLASRDLPMILNTTPGVYATMQGGGSGDSRINVRGFNQRNVAVMINGVPVNDMENGWVYWSNWAGLGDVTSSIQVQRGLGASEIVSPSIGGTINVITRAIEADEGAVVKQEFGSDNLQKTTAIFSSGLMENDVAFSAMVARKTADGWVDNAWTDEWSYFFTVGTYFEDHTLDLTVVGSPQQHGQRTSDHSINTFQARGIDYNSNWGKLHGKALGERVNFYHKPVVNLNHNWKINETTTLYNVLYGSVGTGGGTGQKGSWWRFTDEGLIDFDSHFAENEALGESATFLRASRNNHYWYGLISNMKMQMDNLNISFGVDGRYYIGEHYRTVENLLGGDFATDRDNKQRSPDTELHVGDRFDYNNDGITAYYGVFGQAEYKMDKLTTFFNVSVANTGYQRVDYFLDRDTSFNVSDDVGAGQRFATEDAYYNYKKNLDPMETDFQNFMGYTVKAGANFNLTEAHNIFANVGYYSKAPGFDNVYDFANNTYQDPKNEKIIAFEGGYGLSTSNFAANLNGYYTMWQDKAITRVLRRTGMSDLNFNITGLEAIHMGAELEFRYMPTQNLEFTGMVSHQNNEWKKDVTDVILFDEDDPTNIALRDTINIYPKGLMVADAPQTSVAFGMNYKMVTSTGNYFYFNPIYKYFGRHWADFDPDDRQAPSAAEADRDQPWRVPDYGLLDIHIGYSFELESQYVKRIKFGLNMFNAINKEFIADAADGSDHNKHDAEVYYGRPRNVTMSVTFDL